MLPIFLCDQYRKVKNPEKMLVRSMLQLSQWARNGQLGITALQQSQFQKRTYFNYLNYIKSKKYPFEDPEFDNK